MWANFVNYSIKEEGKLYSVDNSTDKWFDQGTLHVIQIIGDTSVQIYLINFLYFVIEFFFFF